MGTITTRKRRDGIARYTAQIRLKRGGKLRHTEAQTFERRAAAAAWLKKREGELALPSALDRIQSDDPTLAEIIDRYINESVKASTFTTCIMKGRAACLKQAFQL